MEKKKRISSIKKGGKMPISPASSVSILIYLTKFSVNN